MVLTSLSHIKQMALCHGFLTWCYRLQSFVECRTSYRDKIAETFNSNTHWIINPIKTVILSFELAPNLTSKENKQKTQGHQIYQTHSSNKVF
jgi:hypothetical protein